MPRQRILPQIYSPRFKGLVEQLGIHVPQYEPGTVAGFSHDFPFNLRSTAIMGSHLGN
jgi:hypothetical protein